MVVAKVRTERDVACGPEGLKAGAGLRGPYGTSVRYTWPTWILLIPTVTFISMPLFFSPSFPPFLSSQRSSSFWILLTINIQIYKYTRPFLWFCSFFIPHINIWSSNLLFSYRHSTPKSPVFSSVYSALHTYVIYHLERIPDISIPSVM